jgi:hypothetical protein
LCTAAIIEKPTVRYLRAVCVTQRNRNDVDVGFRRRHAAKRRVNDSAVDLDCSSVAQIIRGLKDRLCRIDQPRAAVVHRAHGFVWGLIASMYLGNVVGLVLVLTTAPTFASILRAPFTLALVLGSRAEDAFRLSMIGSGGDMKVFWSSGLVGSITTLATCCCSGR